MTDIPLDAIGEAAFVTDADFRVIDCNARAIELFRAPSREALIGLTATDFPNDHDLSAEFPTYLRERLTAVPFVVLENHVKRLDGSTFVSETILHRLADGRVFVTLRDVSVRVESLHRLEEANERLRAAVRDRTEFVSNVSHELRTPLTSMSYALTNMTRGLCGPLPDKAKDYVGRLQVDVKRLLTTVNDILDLRQMENGTLTLRKSCVPLTKLFGEVVDSLSIQAQTKRQTLTLAPAPKEIYAEADRHKIERVCFNILSNAIKYTPEGGAIAVSVTEQDGQALLRVADNGIGIPPEALPRVSQRYFRVGDQVTGTGSPSTAANSTSSPPFPAPTAAPASPPHCPPAPAHSRSSSPATRPSSKRSPARPRTSASAFASTARPSTCPKVAKASPPHASSLTAPSPSPTSATSSARSAATPASPPPPSSSSRPAWSPAAAPLAPTPRRPPRHPPRLGAALPPLRKLGSLEV